MNILTIRSTTESKNCAAPTPVQDVYINDPEYVKSPDEKFQALRYAVNKANQEIRQYLKHEYVEGEEKSLNLAECEAGIADNG